jgi:hypothetical protein
MERASSGIALARLTLDFAVIFAISDADLAAEILESTHFPTTNYVAPNGWMKNNTAPWSREEHDHSAILPNPRIKPPIAAAIVTLVAVATLIMYL